MLQVKLFFSVQTCCSKEWGYFLFFWRLLSVTFSSVVHRTVIFAFFQHVSPKEPFYFLAIRATQRSMQGLNRQSRLFAQMVTTTPPPYNKTITQCDQTWLLEPESATHTTPKPHNETESRRESGQRARHHQVPHSSAASRPPVSSWIDAPAAFSQMCSIINTWLTKGEPQRNPPHMLLWVTYVSLLCISSMRSVKRTSRFLSQKPSAS